MPTFRNASRASAIFALLIASLGTSTHAAMKVPRWLTIGAACVGFCAAGGRIAWNSDHAPARLTFERPTVQAGAPHRAILESELPELKRFQKVDGTDFLYRSGRLDKVDLARLTPERLHYIV